MDKVSGIDIAWWIQTNEAVSGWMGLEESERPSVDLSSSEQSQVLEDYPALLSYAINKFWVHAIMAETEGTNPYAIIDRLLTRGTWRRFATLMEVEDLDAPSSSIRGFADLFNFESWQAELADSAYQTSERSKLAIQLTKAKRKERQGSVASFSSAGSHTGSVAAGS